MSTILHVLDIDTVLFTFLDYPMSYIEFVGTILYLWSVWLVTKRNMLTWPVGIVSVILFFFLFYQIRLYAVAAEQIYYLGACVYGWWYWYKGQQEEKAITIKTSSWSHMALWAIGVLIASICVSVVVSRLHIMVPAIFPEPAAFPFLDALTTVMSFAAMYLMARKLIESWVYWVIVNIVSIWLYYLSDVRFLSLLYVVLLVIAIKGFLDWKKNIVPSIEHSS